MPLQYIDAEKKVKDTLGARIFKEMLGYVERADPPFWGEVRPRFFTKRIFVLAMYHDITALGYNKILDSLEGLGFKLADKSFKYNTKSVRRTLAKWGRSKVKLGKLEDWEAAMRNVKGRQRFPHLHFWMDSTDFKMVNKGGKKKKDPYWSFKCNSKGRRYMILRDGKGIIRKMWGGYSPKVFDGTFLDIQKGWLEERLHGSGVIADQHFESGKKLSGVTFYTAFHEPRFTRKNNTTTPEDDDAVNITTLTQEQTTFNAALYKLRARVELPFGEAKSIFGVLRAHWQESDNQLDHMVWVATGISNFRR